MREILFRGKGDKKYSRVLINKTYRIDKELGQLGEYYYFMVQR